MRILYCGLIAIFTLQAAPFAAALDYVTIKREGRETKIVGKVLVEAADGGVLVVGREGRYWLAPKEELAERTSDDLPFKPYTRDETVKKLMAELPAGFRIHQTKHYLIGYNTSQAYAQWVGGLYERLYGAFFNYWQRRKCELHDPEFPLIALVFESQASYAEYSRGELGEATKTIIGFYSLMSNRVNMYDLTGTEESNSGDRGSSARINQVLSQPGAERTVATIIHEATHQIAYNTGLQVRFADVPFWVNEGLAIYFETPDLSSAKGWKNIGGVNDVNLTNFRKLLRDRAAGSLEALLSDDKRFRDSTTAVDAYAEAWALNYFLLKRREQQYVKYLRELATLTPLVEHGAEYRLQLFRKHFGEDLAAIESEFLKFMRGVE